MLVAVEMPKVWIPAFAGMTLFYITFMNTSHEHVLYMTGSSARASFIFSASKVVSFILPALYSS